MTIAGEIADFLASKASRSATPLWEPGKAAADAAEPEAEAGDASGENEPEGVPFMTAAELLTRPFRPRQFVAGEAIPAGQVTELRGDGGGGKSTLAIQLCVGVVTGRSWLDMDVTRGPAVYLASEDDADEVQRRLNAIATHYAVSNEDLRDLHVWPLATEDPALVALDGGKLKPTARWLELVAKVEAVRPVVVVLDSRADVFAGEELNRQQVRTFVGLLRKLAVKTGAAVVLLAHPSLSGMANGSGNSGSTHWGNAVRSALFLRRPDDPTGTPDPDARELLSVKANYSRGMSPLQLRWSAGAFVVAEGSAPRSVSRQEAENEADKVFLRLLAKMTARGLRVRPTTGHNYAPKLFQGEEGACGIRSKGFEAAMRRLLDAGAIRVVTEGPPSRRSQFLEAVEAQP